jgi:superfamily II DNA or RNA helicase
VNVTPSHADQAALATSRTLVDLGKAARALGLDRVLDEPLRQVARDPALDVRAVALLEAVQDAGDANTLGELLSPGPGEVFLQLHATRRIRESLLDVARARLLAGLSDRPAVGPRGPDMPPPPETIPELEAWAAEHGAENALDLPVDVLAGRVAGNALSLLRMWSQIARLGDLVVAGPWTRSSLAAALKPGGVAQVRGAAWRYLLDEAEALRAGLTAERQLLSAPLPEEPVLRGVIAALRELRARLRRSVAPREATPPLLQFEGDPPAFTAEIPGDNGRTVAVRLDLSGWESHDLEVSCSCTPGREPSCAHVLAALDALLAFLQDPNAERARAGVIEELKLPTWARALRALDEIRAKGEERRVQGEEARIAWRLRPDDPVDLIPYLQRKSKRGWSSGRAMGAQDLEEVAPLLGRADREALEALGLRDAGWRSHLSKRSLAARVPVALRALVGHPRVYLDGDDMPLEIREGRVGLAVREGKSGDLVFVPTVRGEPVSFPEILALLEGRGHGDLAIHVDRGRGSCTVFRVDAAVAELLRVLHRQGARFPRESHVELITRLPTLEAHLPLALPPALKGDEVPPRPDVVLRLSPLDGAGLRVEALVRPLPGGAAYPPGEGPAEITGTAEGRRAFTRRTLAAERERVRGVLAALPLRPDAEGPPFEFLLDRGEEGLDFLAALAERQPPEVIVEWPEEGRRALRRAGIADLRVRVEKKRDWFGLEGEIEVEGERVRLALLLEAARRGRRYVEVKEGLWLALGAELQARLAAAADHLSGTGGIEAGIAAAPAIEALAEGAAEFTAVKEFHEVLARIRAAEDLVAPLPANLHAELRDYQVSGYEWLRRLASWGAGGCLADDMGLGKTVQALAVLLSRAGEGPALVLAPTSVCRNWVNEGGRFAPSLRMHLYREHDERDRDAFLAGLGPNDVVIASYGLLVRDTARLAGTPFATLVVDEAQAVKNPATRRARAARDLDAGFRFALTGTPLENHLGELWSLYRVVFPGLLGSWDWFRERFAGPIERDGNPDRRKALTRLLSPFLLRRTKDQVARELPPRTEIEVPVTLSAAETRLYEDARLAAVARLSGLDGEGAEKPPESKRFEVLAAITRLRLCACHPRLYDPASTLPSAKHDRLLQVVEELREEGHRALVFSQFTSHLALVREALDARRIPYLYLDGQTPPARRDELVDAFQRGEGDLFLISLKAGGTGLNLTAADYVIHLDPWWNPAVEDQATDRAHRIGQDKPVTVLRLVARGTIEEAILGLHGEKRALVAGVLEGADGGGQISTAQLLELLRGGGVEEGDEEDAAEGTGELTSDDALAGEEPPAAPPREATAGEPGPAGAEPDADTDADTDADAAPAEEAPGPEPEPAPEPAAGPLPRCLGGDASGLRSLVADFVAHLRDERHRGVFATDGPVKNYGNSARRFAAFVEAQAGALDPLASFDTVSRAYLEAVETGRFAAPKSEPILARSALRRLGEFLRDHRHGVA